MDGEKEDLFGGEEDESDPDPDNPFDFRNYTSTAPPASAPLSPDPPRPVSKPAAAPAKSRVETAPPPTQKSRPAAPAPRKRKSPPPPVVVASKKKQPVPTVRLDRKASIRPTEKESSDEDEDQEDNGIGSSGLEIDYGGSTPPFKKKNAFTIAAAGNGPISLRSAASSASPASRLHTPLQNDVRRQTFDAADEIDFGDGGGDDGYKSESEEEDADGEADGDVDELDLGSPAQTETARRAAEAERVEIHTPIEEPEPIVEDHGLDDFDFDFVKEMEKELAGDQSEEESEEE